METKYNPGDEVYIKGEIIRIEITPQKEILYYFRESKDKISFKEESLLGKCNEIDK